MEQFRQRIVASCHLAPLSAEECREYIEYRLRNAGWNGSALFSDGAYLRIHDFTTGVPRKINTLMDRILLYGFLEELEQLDEEAVDAVVKEVKEEMFTPEAPVAKSVKEEVNSHGMTDTGTEIRDVEYYKTMLNELVDALDSAISHKVKLTQYIDKLLKKKYKTYIRMKDE